MQNESMTDQEWSEHIGKSLRFDTGMILLITGKTASWMWFDHDRPDVATLPDLYKRTKDLASLITISYAPTDPGIYNIHVEVLYPPAPISFSLLVPDLFDNEPFLAHLAKKGHWTIITEHAPEDWGVWRKQRGIKSDAKTIEAIMTTYQPRGFVLDIGQDAQNILQHLMDEPRPIGE